MLFWKRNYEKEIELLGDKMKRAKSSSHVANQRVRRFKALFILYASILYAVYLLVAAVTGAWTQSSTKFRLTALPGVLFLIYKIGATVLGWFDGRTRRSLKSLQKKRDDLVEEYKKSVNYNQIQKVLASSEPAGDSESSKKQPKKQRAQPKSKAPAVGGNKEPLDPSAQQILDQIHKDQKKAATGPAVAPGSAPVAASMPPAPLAPGPGVVPGSGPRGAPPMVPPNFQPQPYHPSWMDRIADLVLGENETSPNSRYALICPVCYTHNGLAAYGEKPEKVTYRCPVCGTWNGPKEGSKEGSKEPSSPTASKSPTASPEMEEVEPSAKSTALESESPKSP